MLGAPVGSVRLAELIAALSLGIDLGFGQPMEHALRQCLIALRLSERLGLDERARSAVYFTSLLISVGCHADAHEQAKWFGDDIAVKANKFTHGMGFGAVAASMRMLGAGRPPLHRFRLGLEFMVSGHREMDVTVHAALARTLGEQLGLPEEVLDSLAATYERWDGRGWPGKRSGHAIPLAARVAQIAEFVEVAHRVGGVASATALARKQRGKQFDPTLADLLCRQGEQILGGVDGVQTWTAVIDAEPALAVVVSGEKLDAALLAIANFVDLKSPYSLGHSGNVAELSAAAASILGLPPGDVETVRRAALVHGFGRLGVWNAILRAAGHSPRRRPERPAGLTAREIEVLRLLARGLSTKEISQRLTVTPKTASNHIEHIYAKIDATNRASASLFAVHHGLLDVDDPAERPPARGKQPS